MLTPETSETTTKPVQQDVTTQGTPGEGTEVFEAGVKILPVEYEQVTSDAEHVKQAIRSTKCGSTFS